MTLREGELFLSPINPFTKRQGQVVELYANRYGTDQIASILGISRLTVQHHITGTGPIRTGNEKVSYRGVFGTIEIITGKRPNYKNWIAPLIGDVLFFKNA